jgi:cell division transport system permease protein
LASGVYFVIKRKAQVSIQTIAWIGWNQTLIAMAGVAAVGLLLSIIPTLITTRKYLRV